MAVEHPVNDMSLYDSVSMSLSPPRRGDVADTYKIHVFLFDIF